jgi:hypothetical protein
MHARPIFLIRRLIALTLAASLTAGCLTTGLDSSIPESELSPSQIAMRQRTEALNSTIWQGAGIGALIGAVAGAILSENRAEGALIGGATGAAMGGLAGNYVATKQQTYGNHLDVLESMVTDVRRKNGEAAEAIQSMRAVVAEDRRKLAALNKQYAAGAIPEPEYSRRIEIIQADRQEILNAAQQTQHQAQTFKEARQEYQQQNPQVNTSRFDTQIAALSNKASAMTQLAENLTDEGLGS